MKLFVSYFIMTFFPSSYLNIRRTTFLSYMRFINRRIVKLLKREIFNRVTHIVITWFSYLSLSGVFLHEIISFKLLLLIWHYSGHFEHEPGFGGLCMGVQVRVVEWVRRSVGVVGVEAVVGMGASTVMLLLLLSSRNGGGSCCRLVGLGRRDGGSGEPWQHAGGRGSRRGRRGRAARPRQHGVGMWTL